MPQQSPPVIERISCFGLVVSSLMESELFFEEAFDAVTLERREPDDGYSALMGLPDKRCRQTLMQIGDQKIALVAYEGGGRPYPAGSTSTDLWFQHFAIIVSDMSAAYAQLQRTKRFSPISEGGPVQLPPASGGVAAFKFRDSDGHPLELLSFPAGKAPDYWAQRSAESLFLGIDHSAVSVADTTRTTDFLQKCFGLKQSMQQENVGPAQARMDDVADARVTVTGMAPLTAPPHVELLGYKVGSRRAINPNTAANDLASTYYVLETDDLSSVIEALSEAPASFISPGSVILADGRSAIAVLDPDGHRFVVQER